MEWRFLTKSDSHLTLYGIGAPTVLKLNTSFFCNNVYESLGKYRNPQSSIAWVLSVIEFVKFVDDSLLWHGTHIDCLFCFSPKTVMEETKWSRNLTCPFFIINCKATCWLVPTRSAFGLLLEEGDLKFCSGL